MNNEASRLVDKMKEAVNRQPQGRQEQLLVPTKIPWHHFQATILTHPPTLAHLWLRKKARVYQVGFFIP